MGPTEFIAALSKGKTAAAYFFCGPDRFLHEECRSALIASLPPEAREWCVAEIEFQPGRLKRELDAAAQMPMLGGHNYLLFSDAEDFKGSRDEDYEALNDYLDRPPSFSTVVFTAVEPDRRRRLIQLLEKKTTVVEMLPLTRRDAAAWLKRGLQKDGIEIEGELAEKVAAKFETNRESRGEAKPGGVNLLWLRTELEKVLTAYPQAKRLEAAHFELMVGFREEHVIGKLLRAIADRQFPKALESLRALLASKESEMLLLWSIGDLFRQSLKNTSIAGGRLPASLGSGRGGWNRFAHPFSTLETAQQAVRAYPREELLHALRLVRQADLGIKSSWKDSRILLEFLLWQIIVGKGSESVPAFELPTRPAEA